VPQYNTAATNPDLQMQPRLRLEPSASALLRSNTDSLSTFSGMVEMTVNISSNLCTFYTRTLRDWVVDRVD
jgi:hypothetical protein